MAWHTDEKYRNQIVINLDNGVYCLSMDSSVGKSALAKWLRDLNVRHGEKVNSIRGAEGTKEEHLGRFIPSGCKVFMLDDYDLYNGKFVDEIKALREEAIVLVDCKMLPRFNFPVHRCHIWFRNQNLIEVGC